jgi:uncharacterized membrane protein YadS
MENRTQEKLLTTRNLTWIFVALLLLVFIFPSAGIYSKHTLKAPYASQNSLVLCCIEAIVLSVVWSFSALLQRRWKKVFFMTVTVCHIFLYCG